MIIKKELIKFKQKFKLDCGDELDGFELMTETYGELNKEKSNAILVCHAFSGNHHAAGKNNDGTVGWWDQMIGPNKPIDTNKYFVVCSNNIGGCAGTSGPTSIDPQTGEPYGKNFPSVTVNDWVNSQKLLTDYYGIEKWEFVAGGSLGGMQALQWAISFPDKIKKAGVFAAAAKASTQNIAMNEVAREAIRKDNNFHDGNYLLNKTKPLRGLKTARMLGHITYLSEEHLDLRFGRKFQDSKSKIDGFVDYEIENYLKYKGEKFSDSFDANSYILMTKAMDNYDPASNFDNSLEKAIESIECELLILSFETDWLFPPKRSLEIQLAAIKSNLKSSYVNLKGTNGHDSFLFSTEEYADILERFIAS